MANAGWTTETGEGSGDARSFRVRTDPSGAASACVAILHGMGDHIGRYAGFAGALAAAGIAVRGIDLPGHGRSGGRRGDFADYAALMHGVRAWCLAEVPAGMPWFVYGHSFGGLLAIRSVQEGALAPDGVVVSAPWLHLALEPPPWKLAAANLLARCLPAFSFRTGIDTGMLGTDQDFVRSIDPDRLAHGRISVRAFLSTVAQGHRALSDAARFTAPLLAWHGDADPVMDWRACERFVAGCGSADRTLRVQPAIRHEPQNDAARGELIAETIAWVLARTRPPAAGA
jgi:alpha-beta hydrolase superfamily lysophospholipase